MIGLMAGMLLVVVVTGSGLWLAHSFSVVKKAINVIGYKRVKTAHIVTALVFVALAMGHAMARI